MYLRTVLTWKYLDIIHTMRLSADASFRTVKQILLQASEYTMTNAGDKLMNAGRYQLKHLSALDLLLHFERLVKRLLGGLNTIAEATHVLSKTVIRNYLCAVNRKYLDSREVTRLIFFQLYSHSGLLQDVFQLMRCNNTQGKDTAKVRNAI